MTLEEFSKELSRLIAQLYQGMEVGAVPIRITFQLYEGSPDPVAPLQVDLMVRRRWRD